VTEPLIEVRDLVKRYPATTAVDGISFSVPPGRCFGLLGPNGAGKTTTVEIIEGILPPTSGEVRYRGEPLGSRFREDAGILFQKTALQDFLTVRQSIALFRGLYARGLDVEEVIRLCSLEKLAEQLRSLGFHDLVPTTDGERIDLDGLGVTILAMTSPADREKFLSGTTAARIIAVEEKWAETIAFYVIYNGPHLR
jgi:ABC-type sugar transport system ATPase subunit